MIGDQVKLTLLGGVDRYEILRPEDCVYCGQKAFATVAVKIEKQSVAQLVERPIEIVEYHNTARLRRNRG